MPRQLCATVASKYRNLETTLSSSRSRAVNESKTTDSSDTGRRYSGFVTSSEEPPSAIVDLSRVFWETFNLKQERRFAETGASEFGHTLMTQIRVTPGTSIAKRGRALRSTTKAVDAKVTTLEAKGLVSRVSHPLRPEVRELHVTEAGRRSINGAALSDRQLGFSLETALGQERFAMLTISLQLVTVEAGR